MLSLRGKIAVSMIVAPGALRRQASTIAFTPPRDLRDLRRRCAAALPTLLVPASSDDDLRD